MLRAYSMIRSQPHYRADAFARGLAQAGYRVFPGRPVGDPKPGELLVVWNRYGETEHVADAWEARGGTVIVAENGYLARGGGTPKYDVAKGPQAGHYYALALGGHNGRGRWPQGGPERFAALEVPLAPLRSRAAGPALIAPNRSFGQRGGIMPHDWADRTQAAIGGIVRHHPGNHAARTALSADLARAGCVVIWSSSVGVHALVAGLEVICCAPWWICRAAASELETPTDPQAWEMRRIAALERLAWAQWTLGEIESGEPFARLAQLACTSTPPATCTA